MRRAREGPRHPACARPCPRRAEQATWVLSGLCFVWLIFAATQQRDCTRAYPVEEKLKVPLKPWHHMVYIKVGYAGKRLPVAFTRRGTRPRDVGWPADPLKECRQKSITFSAVHWRARATFSFAARVYGEMLERRHHFPGRQVSHLSRGLSRSLLSAHSFHALDEHSENAQRLHGQEPSSLIVDVQQWPGMAGDTMVPCFPMQLTHNQFRRLGERHLVMGL